MVNRESRADRGGRPRNKGRGHRAQRDTKPALPREKNPPQEAPPAPPAPRGSLIAKRLARSAPHPWTALTVSQRTVQVSPPPCGMPAMLIPARSSCTPHPAFRPPRGKAVSHRRPSSPRAGSPAYWAPRLGVPPSGQEFHTGHSLTITGPNMSRITAQGDTPPPYVHPAKAGTLRELTNPSHSHHPTPLCRRGRTPSASRNFAHARESHTLALSISHKRFQCRRYIATGFTLALPWAPEDHLYDDMYPSRLPGGFKTLTQGRPGETLPYWHRTPGVRGTTILPLPRGTRNAKKLPTGRHIHALGGTHAPP
jgi:hypothetical protein